MIALRVIASASAKSAHSALPPLEWALGQALVTALKLTKSKQKLLESQSRKPCYPSKDRIRTGCEGDIFLIDND